MATSEQIKKFINQLGALAVNECNRRIQAGKGYVLPSVCIAQSAIETGWGTAGIMVKANAYFGIKAGGSWTGAVYRADTWEVDSGGAYNTTANFRAYPSLEASVTDYYDLIGNNSRYSKALSYGTEKLSPRACITAIWSGGYATDTLYVEKIMSTINARNLTVFDDKIDGVTVNGGYDGVETTYTKSDFKYGGYVITDSGRSIGHHNQTSTAELLMSVSLDWEKAYTAKYDGPLTISFIENTYESSYEINIARLYGDTPTIETNNALGGLVVNVRKGEKIGVYLTINTVIGAGTGALTFDLTNGPDLKIKFVEGSVSSGEEITPGELAFFVKIE